MNSSYSNDRWFVVCLLTSTDSGYFCWIVIENIFFKDCLNQKGVKPCKAVSFFEPQCRLAGIILTVKSYRFKIKNTEHKGKKSPPPQDLVEKSQILLCFSPQLLVTFLIDKKLVFILFPKTGLLFSLLF